MKLIFALVALSLCAVDAGAPRPALTHSLLHSEEQSQDAADRKLHKVVEFESSERETPWIDQHLLEITPLRPPKSYPPVAFVVETPKHKKPQKKPSKKPKTKRPKKPKKQKHNKSKGRKKSAKKSKDRDNRYGKYTQEYPNYSRHHVIPLVYPDVTQPRIQIKPYISESSEEYKHRQVKQKTHQHSSSYDVDDVSASDSVEYDKYHNILHGLPRKQRVDKRKKDRNAKTAPKRLRSEGGPKKTHNKHPRRRSKPKYNAKSSSEENERFNQHNEHVSKALNPKDASEESSYSSETRELHDEERHVRKYHSQNHIKRLEHHKPKRNRDTSEDYSSEENKNVKVKKKPSHKVSNSESAEIIDAVDKDHLTKSSESVENHLKESLDNNYKMQIKERHDIKDHTSSKENANNETYELDSQNDEEKSVEEQKLTKTVKYHIQLHPEEHKSGYPSNEIDDLMHQNHRNLNKSTYHSRELTREADMSPFSYEYTHLDHHLHQNEADIKPDWSQHDLHFDHQESQKDLINLKDLASVIGDTSVLRDNLHAYSDLEAPLPIFPSMWFGNQPEQLDDYINSEEKLRAEYNKNLENLSTDQKLNIHENTTQEDWINTIDEIIDMLQEEKLSKITEKSNMHGIIVTKHNPKTGEEDKVDENSIFITKIEHPTQDGHNDPDEPLDINLIKSIYKISHNVKPNHTIVDDRPKVYESNSTEIFFSNNKYLTNETLLNTEDSPNNILTIDFHAPLYKAISDEPFYEELQQKLLNVDYSDMYDKFIHNLNVPDTKHHFGHSIKKHELTDDDILIPEVKKEYEDLYLPHITKHHVENKDNGLENHGTVQEVQPKKVNDTFVFDGKVDHVFILDQDSTTESHNIFSNEAYKLFPHFVKEKEHSQSSEDSFSGSSWISLQSNENTNAQTIFLPDNSDKINSLQDKSNYNHTDTNADLDVTKEDKITLHVNHKHNDSHASTRHRIEIVHNHNDKVISNAEESENIEAGNLGQEVKYGIGNCDAKNNELKIPAHKNFNLSFLFNKR